MARRFQWLFAFVLGLVVAWLLAATLNPTTLEFDFKEGFRTTGGTSGIRNGAAPPATCTTGGIFIDTDETDDTNCTTTSDNSLCLCVADDTWVQLDNN
jgi:hypothetical protein